VYNGTFVIGLRPSSACVEIIFAADSILERARVLHRSAWLLNGDCFRTSGPL
jgi:hypothetical protein